MAGVTWEALVMIMICPGQMMRGVNTNTAVTQAAEVNIIMALIPSSVQR